MIRQLAALVTVFVLVPGVIASADAATITYTFEAPQFIFGQSTTLANRAPNIGSPTFLTTFAASPTVTGFTVFGGAVPNPLFSAQHLLDPTGVADILQLSFNTAVFRLQVDFGLFLQPTSPAGALSLTTPVGSTTAAGGNVGGSFQGGTLVFNSAVPFLTAQLTGFSSTGAQIFFAVDDLVLDTEQVPEPAMALLLVTVLAGSVRLRARRAREGTFE